ncbi:hypothetical protein AB205_0130500 [Aquarana catesbeiana]|uniref:Uncharacterized protein n=1 Tax=Aquarana catesbeiana TaxID=8400 RepID=A0A2G9RDI2_AQUCT|nr:hypothetical protein AB205_0130500 [Aquarana catesbeiana]
MDNSFQDHNKIQTPSDPHRAFAISLCFSQVPKYFHGPLRLPTSPGLFQVIIFPVFLQESQIQ